MEELSNLVYKDEVESLKDETNFEQLGDERYINHKDVEARLYWAFCRPSGSTIEQIKDSNPLVSIMAFNHSKLGALQRFQLLHVDVVKDEDLRKKIKNRTRMLFRALIDGDFKELNEVLEIVPIFIGVAVDQLKNGRKWNDIDADLIEATAFIEKAKNYLDETFFEALFLKLKDISEDDATELKEFLEELNRNKESLHVEILKHFKNETYKWSENSTLHVLQKKSIENLTKGL
ncbi:MAG: hypothetical protein U9N42_08825 [Campylobacterota bacterium]|nr:hypothetical protein [Campylobacterota bacterium]